MSGSFPKKNPLRPLKSVEAVLFDLDGTLLQVAMDRYIPQYIRGLGNHVADIVEPEHFARIARSAVGRLFTHPDGLRTNEELFLDSLAQGLGVAPQDLTPCFNRYYSQEMPRLNTMVQTIPRARAIVETCIDRGRKVVLATNPVFPRPLVEARLEAAGLDGLPFAWITTYENSYFCKPDRRYFKGVADAIDVDPERCLMVGNDTHYDLGAQEAGMVTYLVNTFLDDRLDGQWLADFQGDHMALERFMAQLGAEG